MVLTKAKMKEEPKEFKGENKMLTKENEEVKTKEKEKEEDVADKHV